MPDELRALEPFVGRWRMVPSFANVIDAPRAFTTFEWLAGKRFLIQRWEVEHPDAPDGIAIIGFDPAKTAYLQHYFDSREVVRIYELSFANSKRIAEHPDFSHRFIGHFADGGNSIVGSWETSNDKGLSWSLTSISPTPS